MTEQLGRTLRASSEGIQKANIALLKFAGKADLAAQLNMSRTTIHNFFAGKPVQLRKFHEIYKKLGLKFQDVVDLPNDEKPILDFISITIDTYDNYWQASCQPPQKFKYPFNRKCKKYFNLKGLVYDTHPIFNITLQNIAATTVILTEVGIEVVSVAHIWYCYGEPEAAKLKMGDDVYVVEIPDLRSKLGMPPRREIDPQDLHNELVWITISDPVRFDGEATFRYKLLLENYINHIPNNALLRLWVKTNKKEERSEEFYLCTL